ncbi:hypothetical protein RclHR1_02780004 [Rhizophagus clarus]|uniref:Galactose oxidase n=1 Tax=Rhizophagus clarus TaxID=94130 RepID=A0A2Z6RI55_9GLOM|nr:hypothetical protein RclHR1_02780004 [Rhizophagus clarus]GES82210.1 hypothetical protein GLOIN_2v1834755 [Rhizophagus clarus]
MSKNSPFYYILWVLLQVLVVVNCQLTPFKPSVSSRHTATLLDNKLYILAGFNISKISIREFFYLDVSIPFDTQKLSWQDLSNINLVPTHAGAASAKGGANNDTLFLYGGFSTDPTMSLVYTFDPQHVIWNPQIITGTNTAVSRWDLTGVMDNNGKFYLWGGTEPGNSIVNDMLILDTINLSWGKGSSINAPTPRFNFGATLLPGNKIIYIGGVNDVNSEYNDNSLNIIKGVALTLSEVYIYDTIHDQWSTETTTGSIPSNREGFSTVLGLDGQSVIIYGGAFINPGYSDTTLYVLNLTNYNWYVPISSGKIPTRRAFHKANVIGKYMVVSFGEGYDRTAESDILLLDISNNEEYIWTTTFDPSVPMQSPPSSQSSNNTSNNSNNMMIGAIVGSLLGGILLTVGCFFIYKWNKNRQAKNTIYGNNYNNYSQEEKDISTERVIHSRNENITNHEPIVPTSNNNYNDGHEVISTHNNNRLKFFKLLNN